MSGLAQSVLHNSAILAFFKAIEKAIGLVSVMILARILSPEDYGIASIVMIFWYLAETLGTVGGTQFLIQKEHIEREDIDSAFTLNMYTKLVVFACLILAAPLVSDLYDNNNLTMAIWVVSLAVLTHAFTNPGMILLKKELKFKKIAKLKLQIKIVTFFVTIALAYYLKNYWALIIASVFNASLFLIGSYFIHSYRPKYDVSKIKGQFTFSKWILMKNVIGFLRSQIDRILVPKFFGVGLGGEYHMVRTIAAMPSQDIIIPALEPLLSSFSKAKQEKKRFIYQLETSLVLAFIVVAPISSAIYFFPDIIVQILLGEKWANSSNILQVLSTLVSIAVVGNILNQACMSMNKPSLVFFYDLASLICITTFLIMYSSMEIQDFALLRVVIEAMLLVMFLLYLGRQFEFNPFIVLSEITVLALLSVMAGWFGTNISPFIADGSMGQIIGMAITFFSYCLLLLGFHFLFYEKTSRGMHIKSLFVHNVKIIKGKIFPS